MRQLRMFTISALTVAGCAMGATMGQPARAQASGTVQPFSAQEKQQGAQAHTEILQEFGGAYTGTQADYVRTVGQNIAVQSGLSSARTDFTVTLLNSPVNNAFALPGGYIYSTRQLMALMNNEAELAGVLAHEVGHTAARHAKQRQNRATRNSVIGVLATVLGGALGNNGGLIGGLGGLLKNNAMQGAQLLTLGFSRSQETEADDMGIRYLRGAGYDPAALSTVLASLAAQNQLDAQIAGQAARSVPAWASTHPDPASRVRRALDQARTMNVTNGRTNRDAFMAAVNNVLYSDDPAQGVTEGRNFLHPDMRLAFTVPQGFGMANGTAAVAISGTGGQGQFATAAFSGDLDAYVRAAYQSVIGTGQNSTTGTTGTTAAAPTLSAIRRTTVNGLPAATATARATTQSGEVELTIFAYQFAADRAFHFATVAPVATSTVFEPMFASVRRMTDAEARAIRPRRINVVTVQRGDTQQSMANRMAYTDYQLQRFAVLNGLASGAALTPGQKVKIVVYGTR